MKKLEVTDTFTCTPEEFWANFFDPAFMASLDAEAGLIAREELLLSDTPERFHSRFRITPRRELPPQVQEKIQRGLKFLQQTINSTSQMTDVPEPMRKMLEWGRSTFKDFLAKDPKGSPKQVPMTLTYVEEADFDKKTQVLHFTITPDLFKEASSISGTIRLEPTPEGCKRIIEGQISLAIPGAGETLEQHFLEDFERNHAKAAEATRRWLENRPKDV